MTFSACSSIHLYPKIKTPKNSVLKTILDEKRVDQPHYSCMNRYSFSLQVPS